MKGLIALVVGFASSTAFSWSVGTERPVVDATPAGLGRRDGVQSQVDASAVAAGMFVVWLDGRTSPVHPEVRGAVLSAAGVQLEFTVASGGFLRSSPRVSCLAVADMTPAPTAS